MRAFTNTQVSKEQLLRNIRKHQIADAYQKGDYWNEEEETGCGIGCSIHDFEPGMENNHAAYENLFGIPTELAVLEDSLFERMDRDENLGQWPEDFISSIPEGADLGRAAGRWLLKVLEHPESPLAHAQERKATRGARDLLRQWIKTGKTQASLAAACTMTLHDLKMTGKLDDHATCVAEQVVQYVRLREQDGGSATKKRVMLDLICDCAATSYDNEREGIPKDQDFATAQSEGLDILSRLLLETLRETPRDEGSD